MRSRFRSQSGPRGPRESGNLELVRFRRAQRDSGDAGRELKGRSRRRGGRGRIRGRRPDAPPAPKTGFLAWLKQLLGLGAPRVAPSRAQAEARALAEFQQHFHIPFGDPDLLKLALTHRSYLSVTGQGPRESNERLEFLGDSVLGVVTSEFLYRENPDEHEGELTKAKSLLVSKAILSRRALAMGLGRFVLMSHSEVESGGRQRLSILADAFEAVIGAIYLDQGFEPAREFIHKWLLKESGAIVADKRHTNYKSHLQEYVQSTWRTHPVYRIRSEMGPDHSKHFLVEVLVGKRSLGEGRGRNKKEAEQAAARNALERAGVMSVEPDEAPELEVRPERAPGSRRAIEVEALDREDETDAEDRGADEGRGRGRRRGRRGGRGRAGEGGVAESRVAEPREPRVAPEEVSGSPARLATPTRRLGTLPDAPLATPTLPEKEPPPYDIDEDEEVGRPEGPLESLHVDPYAWDAEPEAADEPEEAIEHDELDAEPDLEVEFEPEVELMPEPISPRAPEPPEAVRPERGGPAREERRPVEPAHREPERREPPPSFGRRRGRR